MDNFLERARRLAVRARWRLDDVGYGVLDRVAPRDVKEITFVDALPLAEDPLGQMLTGLHGAPDMPAIIYGTYEGNPVPTPTNASMQVVGPPQGIVGKTSSCLIPAHLWHHGPSVVMSTKVDIAAVAAMVQALKGPVYQFSADGSSIIPGAIQLGYSLLTDDWSTALGRARVLVASAGMAKDQNGAGRFWSDSAELLIAPLLLYGGITGKKDEWFVERIGMGPSDPDGEFQRIITTLQHRGEWTAASLLTGTIDSRSEKTTSDIFATARTIVKPYYEPGVLAMTERQPQANFDELARGEPNAPNHVLDMNPLGTQGRRRRLPGRYATVYITASQRTISAVAPIIQAFLYDWRQACIRLNEEDMLSGGRRHAATLCILDEMASCPIPDLPALLRDASSQLFLLATGFQSFAQHEIWGTEGRALNDLFPTTLILPGLRGGLEQWSKLMGHFDRPVWGGSYGYDEHAKKVWNESLSFSREPNMPEDQIFQGNPIDPECVVSVQSNGWGWVKLHPVYRSHPWPFVIAHAAWRASQIPEISDLGLPWPALIRNGDIRHLHAISPGFAQWFMENRRLYNTRHGRA